MSIVSCPFCRTENPSDADSCLSCGRELYALAAGSLLADRYEILEPLGRGGMGTVYKARDRELDEVVALKVLRTDVAGSAEMARRFRQEIKLARKVRHRNVCAIHEYGQAGPLRFVAMELIDGVDFRRILRQRRLAVDEAYDVAIQVAEGLTAIHEAGVVHRDLKTSNLMRDARGIVRVMDFGIAKPVGPQDASGLTGTGMIVGTPEYMSPEQVRGQPVDERSDIYSLGVVGFELFTGHVPFHGDTPVATLLKHLQEAPPLEPSGADLPAALVPVLLRALAKAPAERFATASEMAAALQRARSVTPKGPITRREPPTRPGRDAAGEHLPFEVAETATVERPHAPPTVVVPPQARPAGRAPLAPVALPRAPTRFQRGRLPALVAVLLGLSWGSWYVAIRGSSSRSQGSLGGGRPAAGSLPSSLAVESIATPAPSPAAPSPSRSAPLGGKLERPLALRTAAASPGLDAGTTGVLAAARAAVERGDYAGASALLDPLVRKAPPNAEASALLVRAQNGQLAQQAERQRQEQVAAQVAALITEAEAAFGDQTYDAALDLYDEALKLDPTNQRAGVGRANALGARAMARTASAGSGTPPRSFVQGDTVAQSEETRETAPGPRGFAPTSAVEVKPLSQPAALPGKIVFAVDPPSVSAGQDYKVTIYLLNEGAGPIDVKDLVITTTVNGRKVTGPIPTLTRLVAPKQKALLAELPDFWRVEIKTWSIEALVRTARGESYRNQIVWK